MNSDHSSAGRAPSALPALTVVPGSVAVVVGGSTGVGARIAHALGKRGYELALLDSDITALRHAGAELAELGYPCTVHQVDERHPDGVAETVSTVLGEPGLGRHVTVVAYNAWSAPAPLTETSATDLADATMINTHSAVAAIQAALPDIRATKGAILVTASAEAVHPHGPSGTLAVGAAALRAAMCALADELQGTGIRLRTLLIEDLDVCHDPTEQEAIAERLVDMADRIAAEETYGPSGHRADTVHPSRGNTI